MVKDGWMMYKQSTVDDWQMIWKMSKCNAHAINCGWLTDEMTDEMKDEIYDHSNMQAGTSKQSTLQGTIHASTHKIECAQYAILIHTITCTCKQNIIYTVCYTQ